MFELVTGEAKHTPRNQSLPILLSTGAHLLVLSAVIAVPLLLVTEQIPEIPSMMAFVAAPPAPPPPPPPAPASPVRKAATPRQAPTTGQFEAVPVEAPPRIEPPSVDGEDVEDVPGGVEGGVPGGVAGGVVGGLAELTPPPPPPPVRRGPVRVGGHIEAPDLIHRVEPYYPPLAVQSKVQGVVILEAVIDDEGKVSDVKVLRSAHPLLDREATLAVRQWRYSPLLLNGVRVPFMLTVTLAFRLEEVKG